MGSDSIVVRSSSAPDNGPRLSFKRDSWDSFIAGIAAGEFDPRGAHTGLNPSSGTWIRSTWESGPPDNSVEVAIFGGEIAVRDSDQPETELIFATAAWTTFLGRAKAGTFDV